MRDDISLTLMIRLCLIPLLAACLLAPGCERTTAPNDNGAVVSERPKPVIEFPTDLEVDDPAVNVFLREALQRCVDGDYDAFRAIWVADEAPPTRGDYEAGWQLARRARVEQISPYRDPDTRQLVYAVRAHLDLDEKGLRRGAKPHREIVLMLVPVEGGWRLKRAPGFVREKMMTDDDAMSGGANRNDARDSEDDDNEDYDNDDNDNDASTPANSTPDVTGSANESGPPVEANDNKPTP